MASGDIKLSSNFELNSQRALDARINVASIAERDALPTIQRYDRMIVSVRAGETYQMKLGLVDNDLANNLNWGLFGTDPNSHIKNFDTQIIHIGEIIPVYVFGAISQSALSVKEYTILFVGSNNYVNEIISTSDQTANLLEVYENDVLIYFQSFAFTLISSRYRFIITTPFNTLAGKQYKLRFRRSDGATFYPYAYSPSVYSENAISYNPIAFTVNYVESNLSIVTGYAKSPIYFIRGSKFSKVETINENVIVTASEMDVKGNVRVEGDLIVEKNIIQNGAAYETHAEQLYTEKDLIILREKAIAGLASNQLSGFKIIKYNGVNNLIFATDLNGIARIGDEGQALQALATREDNPLNGGFAKWNSTTLMFECVDLAVLKLDQTVPQTLTNGIPLLASNRSIVSDYQLVDKKYVDSKSTEPIFLKAMEDSRGVTGFISALGGSDIDVSYNYTDRTITLTGALTYYWQGRVKTLISPWTSVPHANSMGSWYLYMSEGNDFVWSNNPFSFSDLMVAYVYRGFAVGFTSKGSFALREVHGTMDYNVHKELHSQIGTYRSSGGLLTAGTYAENVADDISVTPGFDEAVLEDEDATTSVTPWIQGTYTTAYVGAGSALIFDTEKTRPFHDTGANTYIQINNPVTGTMTDGVNNQYYNVYQVIAPVASDIDSQRYKFIMLQPQVAYSSLAAAQAEDIRSLNLGNFVNIFTEFVIHARITFRTRVADTNAGKCRIETGGVTYITGTKANQISVAGFSTNNHAILSNLNWASSLHTGTPNLLAGFGASGEAVFSGPYLPLSGGTLTGLLTIYKPATQLEIASDTVGNNAEINFNLQSTTPGYAGLGVASSIKSIPVGSWAGGLNSQADLAFFTTNTLGGTALEYMRLKSGGNLGIGTNNPTYLLSLGGTSARTIWMERNTSAGTGGQGLTLSSGGAIAGTANLAGGDLKLSSGISTGTGTSAIRFFTAPAGVSGAADNAPTEKMTILGNGNVGIGTTAPSQKLSVSSAAAFTEIGINSTFGNVNSRNWCIGTSLYDYGDFSIRAGASEGAVPSIYHMLITRSGNVGINTTIPTSKLHVVGLPSYADNAAAVSGGLTTGAFYHTSGILKVVI